MKVLTAAPYIFQGVEVGFCDCEPGELVRLGDTDECFCPRYDDEEEVIEDDVCECHLDVGETPPFLGLVSLAGSTTARVDERGITAEALQAALLSGLFGKDWLRAGLPEDVARALADIEIAGIRQAASYYPVGTLISSLNGFTFRVDEGAVGGAIRRRR